MNHTMKNFIFGLLFISLSSLQASSIEPFQDGDRVCFVGDSITHAGKYHSYVYLYYLTRFPDRNIRTWNKGISGNDTKNVLHRFDQDIAAVKPNRSTIMLGMNDVGRWLYGRDKADAKSIEKQQKYLETYKKKMDQLIAKMEAIKSKVLLITPSIYDQTAEFKTNNNFGVNDALGQCAAYIKESASKRDEAYIDFYDAMCAINTKVQASNKTATIVGPDRVHPGADPGHFVMAYLFLKAQALPKYVSKVVIDAKQAQVMEIENCTVTELVNEASTLTFKSHEKALPFPQTDSIQKGLKLVPFTEDFNQQLLRVTNLKPGSYQLSIDDITIGTYRAEAFSTGMNLAVNKQTPQYAQAMKVYQLNNTRTYRETQLRNAAFSFYNSGLSDSSVDLKDQRAVQEYFNKKLKTLEGKSYYKYFKNNFDNYWDIQKNSEAIHAELDQIHDKLYLTNQTIPHIFKIIRVVP